MHDSTGELRSMEGLGKLFEKEPQEKKHWKEIPFKVGTGLEIEGMKFRVEEINLEQQRVVLKPLGWN